MPGSLNFGDESWWLNCFFQFYKRTAPPYRASSSVLGGASVNPTIAGHSLKFCWNCNAEQSDTLEIIRFTFAERDAGNPCRAGITFRHQRVLNP